MKRFANLAEIEKLDPLKDHTRIYYLMLGYEFPWDIVRALELALYRTFCVPSISALLDKTGEFRFRPQKRYDDTALLIAEICQNGYDSPRGREAIRIMNRQHHRYPISNEDYLYVLTTFIFEPLRWVEKFGWRKPSQNEKLAAYYFWREIGRRMNIKDIPGGFNEIERYNLEYERSHFKFSETNRAVGTATRELFASWFPKFLRPLVRFNIYALLDEPVLDAFGFPHPPRLLRRFLSSSMKLRARVERVMPARKKPGFITGKPSRTYRKGYALKDLGPPFPVEEGRPEV